MKKFIFHIFIMIIAASIILLAFTWYNAHWIREADFRLSENTHIIAIGPSTTGRALNEKHIAGFQNLSRSGTWHDIFITILPKILKDNPKIDTVLISHGRFFFKKENANEVESPILAIRDFIPIMFTDLKLLDWNRILQNPSFYCAMLNPDLQKLYSFKPHHIKDFEFGYYHTGKDVLYNKKADWGIAWYDSIKKNYGSNIYSKEYIRKNCYDTDRYIKKTIDICNENNVVPILLFTPLYQFDRWFDLKGFCDYMEDYDENTLIADYENFIFPDDSYYKDVHHLNAKGADYFTSHIAKHGVETKTLKEWLKEKRQ